MIAVGQVTAGIPATARSSNGIRFRGSRPVQPRSLTRAEQRARATRPELWPAFLEPATSPLLDAPETPELDDGLGWDDDLADDLR